MTQGRGDGVSWVTAFMLSYSLDAYDWRYVDDLYGNQRVCTYSDNFSRIIIIIIIIIIWIFSVT